MIYVDFDVEIGIGSGREYPVTVILSMISEARAIMHLPFDEVVIENGLKDLQLARLRSGDKRRQSHLSEELATQKFGRILFRALFTGEVYSRYIASQREAFHQGKGLRLNLHIRPPELAALPWEFLYDAVRAEYISLSNKTSIVRSIEQHQLPQLLPITSPLRILGMIVNPTGATDQDVDDEKLRVEKAIEKLQATGLIELTWLQGQTWHDLQRAMRHGPWHIFHFIGCGGLATHTNKGLIALGEPTENIYTLHASDLGRLLTDHRFLRLVVLNSRGGAQDNEPDTFSSMATTLVSYGIPAVLAMQYEITDRATSEFFPVFYETLMDGMPIDIAVSEARKAISLKIANTIEWGTPVLYTGVCDDLLFNRVHTPTYRNNMPVSSSNAVEIFYSYAHDDERLRKQLETHLSLLKQERLITGWYDREISAGGEWANEIEAHLNSAQIILLLISPHFMASDYCYGVEMKRALERHTSKEARVIPIILRPTDWKRAAFSKLQVLPSNGRPITKWSDRDEAFLTIAQDIRKAVDELNTKITTDSPSPRPISLSTDLEIALKGKGTSIHGNLQEASNHRRLQLPFTSAFLFNQPLLDPSDFYGRMRERETLINRIWNGASTSVVGPRRVGKTWLMSYLQLVAPKELGTRFLVGYLDATTARCATIAGFTRSTLEVFGLQRPVFDDAKASLVLLEQAIQEIMAKHQTPVLCIDEFEGISNQYVFDHSFFTTLRAMAQAGLSLIVASKSSIIDIVGNNGKTSGFFNVFEQLKIKPFSSKEAERFVRSKGAQAGLTEEEYKYLLRYGQLDGEYWPLRLQLVGKMLWEDKMLAARENDSDYYNPHNLSYWQEFEERLEETYRGVIR